MSERLLRALIVEVLLTEKKYGQQLSTKHFGDVTKNPVIKHAWWKQDEKGAYTEEENLKYRQSFYTKRDSDFYYKDDGKWKTEEIPAGRKLELKSPDKFDIGDTSLQGMPVTTKSQTYVKVQPVTGDYSQPGFIAVTRIEHGVGGAKKSEKLLSDQKMGKMAEYALKQVINGEAANFKEARIGADVGAMYTGSSRKAQNAARAHYDTIYEAALSAIGSLQNVSFFNASVPSGRQALVDVTAQVKPKKGTTALPQDIDLHVKYNDTTRKSGIPAGKELSRKKGHTQTLVSTGEGNVYIKTELPGGFTKRQELANFGARNPSTLRWKGARDKFIRTLESQKPPVIIPDDKFDINVIQTMPHREDYHDMLQHFGYPAALEDYFNREHPLGGSLGPITAYAIFKSNTSGVSLTLEVWEFTSEGGWKVEKIEEDTNHGLMYQVLLGEKNIFNIEFRSGPASGKKTSPHGGPPQIKAGEADLPVLKSSVDSVYGSSSVSTQSAFP